MEKYKQSEEWKELIMERALDLGYMKCELNSNSTLIYIDTDNSVDYLVNKNNKGYVEISHNIYMGENEDPKQKLVYSLRSASDIASFILILQLGVELKARRR